MAYVLQAKAKIDDAVREIWSLGYQEGYNARVRQERPTERRGVADALHAQPTYISGSSDRVYLISEMPTRYIRNVLAMDYEREAKGLERALEAELERRGERA